MAIADDLDDLMLKAEQGYVESEAILGSLYMLGKEVERDHQEALKWLSRAAKQGYMESLYSWNILPRWKAH